LEADDNGDNGSRYDDNHYVYSDDGENDVGNDYDYVLDDDDYNEYDGNHVNDGNDCW
jgi:hypothetical protein